MVYVQNRPAFDVGHRRQFMHPFAIVALIVWTGLCTYPAIQHEATLNVAKRRFVNQYVDVSKQPAQ